jgi:hypothetical protein
MGDRSTRTTRFSLDQPTDAGAEDDDRLAGHRLFDAD